MCGFVLTSGKNVSRDWVVNGIQLLKHRGPDYTGFYSDLNLECAHARLAIIDLDKRSNQPMISDCGTTLLFNGEIFNYKHLREDLEKKGMVFNTNSDSEVILNGFIKHGEKFIKKLNGQFAITIISKSFIYLFRDPSGQKPLYFSLKNNTIYVASELSPFLSINNAINGDYIVEYLENGFSSVSPYNGVEKLTQGSSIVFNRKSNKIIKKYNFYDEQINFRRKIVDRKDLLIKLNEILKSAIDIHCIADVQVGLLLSGGIDSSLLATLLPYHNNITCFTVDFGDNKTEINNAKSIAKHYNLNLEIVSIKDKLNFDDYLAIIDTMKEPIGDSSYLAVYLITKKIREKNIKVVLTGDGADELFAGYSLYRNLNFVYNLPSYLRKFISSSIRKLPIKNRKILKWSNACDSLNKNIHPNLRSFFNESEISEISEIKKEKNKKLKFNEPILKKFMRNDFRAYLSEGLLFKNDCASMSNSVELRSPFLDINLINFIFQELPEKELLRGNKLKSLLIDLAKSRFPKEYLFDKKRGFNFAYSIVNSNFKKDAKSFIKSNLRNNKYLLDLLNKTVNADSWSFYRFHLLFVFLFWKSKN